MNARIESLQRRRQALLLRVAAQRSELSITTKHLRRRLQFVEKVFSIVQALRLHPKLVAASTTLLLPVSRHKLLRWGGRLFTAWQLFTLVRRKWRTPN